MRSSAVALLAFASIATAQTAVTSASAIAVVPGNCPISIEARQQPHNAYLLADTARTVHPSYQIAFRPQGEHAIQQVVLALSGPTGLHIRNATTSNAAASANEVETFNLTGSGDVTVTPKKLTAVQSFSLISVTYADGSRWHSSSTNVCRIAPNGFVLVK